MSLYRTEILTLLGVIVQLTEILTLLGVTIKNTVFLTLLGVIVFLIFLGVIV